MIGKKGTYGYIKRGRIIYAAVTFGLLAAVLGMYFGALRYFGTNKNVFTILAALSCIGVGKFAVDLVMFCRAKCCSESARDAIELHIGELAGAYDLFMTSYDKNFAISHAVCAGRSVCALTEDTGCDVKSGEKDQRFSKYLQRRLPGAPSSFLYKMLRKKNITLNGKKASGSELLLEGDLVTLFLSDDRRKRKSAWMTRCRSI